MIKDVVILGSTGSVGTSTLLSLSKVKNYKIKLITTNKNIKKILNQAIRYKVKDVIVEDKKKYNDYISKFKKKRIRLHLGISNIKKILKKKVYYCINSISGIDGLYPTLITIPLTKNLLMANKESIICGWHLLKKELIKNKTNFVPIDSEHYSIWKLIKNEKFYNVDKIILTASGGPFLNTPKNKIINIKPKFALKHPTWRMGKKISIDSSTMMNKIFEYIEAKKIFNINKKKINILIHPSSFVHAIVFFKGGVIKFLAHETKLTIPISNALEINSNINNLNFNMYIKNFNNMHFKKPDIKKFPLLSILNLIPEKDSYFETVLITLNDGLVQKYLDGYINYISIHKNLINLIKSPYLEKYYKLKPKNIYDIKKVMNIAKIYLEKKVKFYAK